MKVNYRLILRTHDGVQLAALTGVSRWEMVRTLNEIGQFSVIARGDLDPSFLGPDRMVEFWRQPVGGTDELLGVGLMRWWEWMEADGTEVVRFGGPDQMEMLDRRIIAYFSDTGESEKIDYADDMIKAIVREACHDPEAGNDGHGRPRYYPIDHFYVDRDESDAPMMTRSFGWRDVLPVIQEIADASADDGVPLFFDLVPTGPAKFQFRTWTVSRGVNRTLGYRIAPIVFSKEAGNLANPLLRYDFTEEINYVWGGGQGEGSDREIDPENDQVREQVTIWNKRERFQDARECGRTRPCIAARAKRKMERGRPKIIFAGDLLDMPQSRFGVDWGFGDVVTARYRGIEFDGHVKSFRVEVSEESGENVSARLEVTELAYGSPR